MRHIEIIFPFVQLIASPSGTCIAKMEIICTKSRVSGLIYLRNGD